MFFKRSIKTLLQNRSKCLHNEAHLLSVITLFLIKTSNLHFSFIPLILTPTNSGIYGNNGKFTTKQHISPENMENLQRKVYKIRLSVRWGGRGRKCKWGCHTQTKQSRWNFFRRLCFLKITLLSNQGRREF